MAIQQFLTKRGDSSAEILWEQCGRTAATVQRYRGNNAEGLRQQCGDTAGTMRKDCGDAAETVQKDYGVVTWAVPLRTRCRSALLGHHTLTCVRVWPARLSPVYLRLLGLAHYFMQWYVNRAIVLAEPSQNKHLNRH